MNIKPSLTKTYKTRDGHEARVFIIKDTYEGEIVGAYKMLDSEWWHEISWRKNGRFLNKEEHGLDLMLTTDVEAAA